jgi:hypothetical protein
MIVAKIIGIILVLEILWEGFESVVLPRRVTRRIRITNFFFYPFWPLWKGLSRILSGGVHETWLSIYGPLSLLLTLIFWALSLVLGFALILWGGRAQLGGQEVGHNFLTYLYLSGTTFFTLGLGDVVPKSSMARFLITAEAGMGFAFLAMVISYLPLLNQTFARRETNISMLDARAGSPPSAAEILVRSQSHPDELLKLLYDWELWSAQLLEGHLSYPVLAYFRSQHDNVSWLASLTAMLDTCALIIVGFEGRCKSQAQLTFAMARHAVVDLSLVFKRAPKQPEHDRLPPDTLEKMRHVIKDAGLNLSERPDFARDLEQLRQLYEPYVNSLSIYFLMRLPPWLRTKPKRDNWQVSGWEIAKRSAVRWVKRTRGEHF